MLNALKKYDAVYNQNNSTGDENCAEVFSFNDRGTNLILTAPHSTKSFVCKKPKIPDLYTGALAQYLGVTEHVSTIIRNKFTPYKCMISDFIARQNLQNHYFLDLHGFNHDIDYDICLGTGLYPHENYPYIDKIITIADKYKLKYAINHHDYTGKNGLTGRYQKQFVQPNVIQLELKKYLRDFYSNPEIIAELTIPLLKDIIDTYQKIPD